MPTEQEPKKVRPVLFVAAACFVAAAIYAVYIFSVTKTTQPAPVAGTAPQVSQPVRVGTFSTAIDYAPVLIAKSKGWLSAVVGSDAKVDWTTFQTLPTINEAFASGKLDIVFEAEVPAIVGRAAGIDIRIVDVGATLHEGIIVPTKSKVTAFSGLRGKRIAVLSGTAMHYGLLKILQSAGVPIPAVKIVNMAPPDAAAAFASGQIDAWAVWPPWPEEQVVDGRARFLPNGDATIQSVVVMRQGFIHERPALAKAIDDVIDRSKAWMSSNQEEAISIVAEELRIPDKVVRLAWPKHDWAATMSPEFMQDIDDKAHFLLSEKMIQKEVVASDIVASVK
jgi:sulfonate transport system substrate-binding protein